MINNLKVIIVEDNLLFLDAFQKMLTKIPEIVIVHTCHDIDTAYSAILEFEPDLVFLDIKLNGGDAFELLSRFKSINFDFVFTTAYEEYALEAIKLYALHYLLKPFGLNEVKDALNRLAVRKEKEFLKNSLRELLSVKKEDDFKIALYTSSEVDLVLISDIIYCKSYNSYTTFCLTSDQFITVSSPLKKYEELLPDKNFMRVHQSYLVNINAVKKILRKNGNFLMLSNNHTIPISRRKLETLMQFYNNNNSNFFK
jgi:two-component system LytT family response regulator